ncbi:MAG: [protein-PII] uridylyltransferase [bacterium]
MVLSPAPTVHSPIETYREALQSVAESHSEGASGSSTLAKITIATDALLLGVLQEKMRELGLDNDETASKMCLVALGGYGRKEMHPQSDIDIMFLFPKKPDKESEDLVSRTLRHLFDARLQIGNVTRDFAAARSMARQDLESLTAMLEGRLIWGDLGHYETSYGQITQIIRRNRRRLIDGKIQERSERLAKYGDTINIQEPNLKDSPGGLRDYHHALWLASFHAARKLNLPELNRMGLLQGQDYRAVREALEFLWRLRTDLHLLNGKKSDRVTMDLQQELAARLKYCDQDLRLAEENLMRDYYRAALDVQEFADRATARIAPRPVWQRWFHRVRTVDLGDGFVVRDNEIHIPEDIHFFEHAPQRLMDVFVHAVQSRTTLSQAAAAAIYDNRDLIDESFLSEEETIQKIRMIFQHIGRIVPALRLMRRLGILHRLFPEWRGITNLVRHDLHHRYTVDEHTLLTLHYVETLHEDDMTFSSERAAMWQGLTNRDVLRLATFCHDIGKGRGGDHCEIGADMTNDIAERLQFSERERADLRFLVSRHIMMSQTAQRHDLSDPDMVTGFAERVGSARRLDLLYLLTHVDLKAIAPDSMTEWKNHLLTQLFVSAHDVLKGKSFLESEAQLDQHEGHANRTPVSSEDRVRSLLSAPPKHDPYFYSKEKNREEIRHHLALLPTHYPRFHSLSMIQEHVDLIRRFDGQTPMISFHEQVHESMLEIVIVARDRVGLFNRITTAIALENFSIFGSRLNTRDDGIVCDNIIISDLLGEGPVSEMRKELLRERLQRLLVSAEPPPPIPRDRFGPKPKRSSFQPQVEIYEDASGRHSVVDVCGVDRSGLLQDISSEISAMGMNICFARVITEGSRAVDVFYVTDQDGKIISDPDRRRQLAERILSRL